MALIHTMLAIIGCLVPSLHTTLGNNMFWLYLFLLVYLYKESRSCVAIIKATNKVIYSFFCSLFKRYILFWSFQSTIFLFYLLYEFRIKLINPSYGKRVLVMFNNYTFIFRIKVNKSFIIYIKGG